MFLSLLMSEFPLYIQSPMVQKILQQEMFPILLGEIILGRENTLRNPGGTVKCYLCFTFL